MLAAPGSNQEERASWQSTREYGPVHPDRRAVFAIPGVEMWRLVIIEVDRDDDPVEARNLRHRPTVRTGAWLRLISLGDQRTRDIRGQPLRRAWILVTAERETVPMSAVVVPARHGPLP